MAFKHILEGVVVLVIALLIFSYITDATTQYKTKQFLIKSKDKLVSTFNNIKIPEVKDKIMDSNVIPELKTNKLGYDSIKDITQNKESYVGQEVRVKGKLRQRLMSGYNLNDDEGYWVILHDNCIEKQRRYVTGVDSKIYIAEGTFKKIIESYDTYYKISCSKPLE